MATDATRTADYRKPTKLPAPPPEPEHLPCPRCDSTTTKFCYYNNYNSSQPRHFCKACRRYWTHGGTLRDIPVGGATRKNSAAKRPRTTSPTASVSYSSGYHDFRHLPAAVSSQLLLPLSGGGSAAAYMGEGGKMGGGGGFTSLLNSAQGRSTAATGLVALGGFGLGLDEAGFGPGRAVWPFPAMVEAGPSTWQMESGEQSGFVGGGDSHCFGWPDLAISTPGGVLK